MSGIWAASIIFTSLCVSMGLAWFLYRVGVTIHDHIRRNRLPPPEASIGQLDRRQTNGGGPFLGGDM